MATPKLIPPRLIPIDLSKGTESKHPDLREGRSYLCLIGGHWYAGTFSKVWFGWSFDDWNGGPLQFDTPGTNNSKWQAIFEIKEW